MLRKASVALGVMIATAFALGVLALPAFADAYPPIVTTTTTQLAPAPAPAPEHLAFTGSNSMPLVIIALVALTLGTVLMVALRRRGSVQASKSN
ncbi:MAG: hypothetical protein WCI50_02430 [Actinomycetes bacterium]